MNVNKLLVGTLLAFVAYFMGGFLLYTIVFKGLLASTNPGLHLAQAEPNMIALVVGNFAAAFLLTFIFEKLSSVRTLKSGLTYGFIIGALFALSFDCMMLGTTNLMTWSGVLVDMVVYSIISAIAGGVLGWFLGYKRA
jgi:hypothetical protein